MPTDETLVRQPTRRRAPQTSSRSAVAGCFGTLLNLLAAVLVLATCLNSVVFAAIFLNPPLLALVPGAAAWVKPQPTVPPIVPLVVAGDLTPGQTPGSVVFPTFPPTWTPTDTPTVTTTPVPPTATATPTATSPGQATRTRTPVPTFTVAPRGATPTANVTRSPFSYTRETGSPSYLANFVNNAGCSWFGFAGQVFDLGGQPVIGLSVHLEGGGLDVDALTGSSLVIGPGGYLIPIADHPIRSADTYKIQLRNNTGTALSDVFTIETFDDCTRNLVRVNFVQNH